MKLHFYQAEQAPVVVILRQSNQRKDWELIVWNTDTNQFQLGQWLCGKHLDAKTACISPNGLYFGYGYDVYGGDDGWQTHGVASRLPNFTAEYFCGYTGGRIYYSPHFDRKGRLIESDSAPYRKNNPDTGLETVQWKDLQHDRSQIADSGYKQQSFMDHRGRQITSEEGKVMVDGQVIYDTTDHVFERRPPLY